MSEQNTSATLIIPIMSAVQTDQPPATEAPKPEQKIARGEVPRGKVWVSRGGDQYQEEDYRGGE